MPLLLPETHDGLFELRLTNPAIVNAMEQPEPLCDSLYSVDFR